VDLYNTLCSLKNVSIPDGLAVELLIVDNGSSDDTANIVQDIEISGIEKKYIFEPRKGKAVGQNEALKFASGSIILLTDDDVRHPENWISGMCSPIASGSAVAVAGGVVLDTGLVRPWMSSRHRSWLASTEWLRRGNPQSLVGANMSLSRNVLNYIPMFDEELGPGALGFADDCLFASQLSKLGYKIHDALEVAVVHHFDQKRLLRSSWLNAAGRHAASQAYIGYHWNHWKPKFLKLRLHKARRKLIRWRELNRFKNFQEGCSDIELDLAYFYFLYNELLFLSKSARKYSYKGMRKL
jgi:glycosyltransferase involved in cell wall biosynthesis